MTDREIDRLVSTIHEMAVRFGAVFVPDDVKVIIFKRAREKGRAALKAGDAK